MSGSIWRGRSAHLLDAALGYTEQSPQFQIIPVDPVRKRHIEGASTDPATIRRWFQRWSDCGIAVVTGAASGVIVIDADAKHDGEASLAELEGALCPLPRERVARTRGGGLHIYLSYLFDGRRAPNGTERAQPSAACSAGVRASTCAPTAGSRCCPRASATRGSPTMTVRFRGFRRCGSLRSAEQAIRRLLRRRPGEREQMDAGASRSVAR